MLAELSGLLKHPFLMTKLLKALRSNIGKTAVELSDETGISSKRITRKLCTLIPHGLIRRVDNGQGVAGKYFVLNRQKAFELLGLNDFWEWRRKRIVEGQNRYYGKHKWG